jgi:choice-of-anchor A domain-containing protein
MASTVYPTDVFKASDMRTHLAFSLGLALAGLYATSASATPISAATILQDFNAVIYKNGSTSSDIEGASVFGGNFTGATLYNNPTSGLPIGYGALTVFGSTSGNSINLDNGGSAYVAGTKGAKVNFNGGGLYLGAPANTIADFQTALNTLSASLSFLAATGSLPKPDNNELIKATPNAAGIAVFNVSAADLAAISSYKIDLNGAKTLVFNVSGPSVTFAANTQSGTTGANNIIWNFYQATSVNLMTQIAGTVLATNANVTNGNQIDGGLFASSWSGQGELHDYGFTGVLPMPEPASLAMLGAGLVALGLIRRRARR